jgi:signal transduction histidine kinase
LASNINSGTIALVKRLDELLDTARFSKGTFKLNKQSINTTRFIEEVIDGFRPALINKKQSLNLSIIGELPTIVADRSRLEQVIVNLLSNASKYSPGKSNIFVTASIKDTNLLLEVKDQGEGIAQENKKKIFRAYHRVSKNENISGTGLGLYVANNIIKAHGGKIWFTSQSGKGSSFKILIPINVKTNELPQG